MQILSRLWAAILILVFRDRMGDRSRWWFCDPMWDQHLLGPNCEGGALRVATTFWRDLDVEQIAI